MGGCLLEPPTVDDNRIRDMQRLSKVVLEIETLAAQVSPLLVKIGHLRREAAVLETALADGAKNESDTREV